MNIKMRIDIFILFLFLFFSIGCFQIPLDGIISLGLFLLLIVSKQYVSSVCITHNYRIYFFGIFILVYITIAFSTMNNLLLIKYIGNYFLLLTPFLLYKVYSTERNEILEQIIRISKFIMGFWGGIAVTFFVIASGAAPEIAAGTYNGWVLAIGGGQILAYGLTLYTIFVFYKYTIGCCSKTDLLLVIETVILDVMVRSMITILVGILGVGIVVLTTNRRKCIIRNVYALKIILIGCCLICGVLYFPIVRYLYNRFSTIDWYSLNKLEIRLKDIIIFLHEGKPRVGSSIFERQKLYVDSICKFISAPLLGTGQSGEHSTILDAFSMWGMIGGIPFMGAYLYPTDIFKKSKGCLAIVIAFISMATVNPIMVFNVMFIMGFMIPLELKKEKLEEKKCVFY